MGHGRSNHDGKMMDEIGWLWDHAERYDFAHTIGVMRILLRDQFLVLRRFRFVAMILLIGLSVMVAVAAGVEPNQAGATDCREVAQRIREKEEAGQGQIAILFTMQEEMAGNTKRYFFTDEYGWVDGRHFFLMARISQWAGRYGALIIGFFIELEQWLKGEPSGFSPEDLPSDAAGAAFGSGWVRPGRALSQSFKLWCEKAGARLVDDPKAEWASLPKKRLR